MKLKKKKPDGLMPVPARFWKTFTEAEFRELAERDGWLNEAECARLWRMQDRNDPPPKQLQMVFRKDEILKVFPPGAK
jgi:hypothetical protein